MSGSGLRVRITIAVMAAAVLPAGAFGLLLVASGSPGAVTFVLIALVVAALVGLVVGGLLVGGIVGPLRALETPDDNQWTEGNAYVSLKWTPHLILVGGWEFTTLAKEQANKHQFFNASVQWDITPATSLRVFYGGVRPGLKCISGVCRDFPAFEGGKLELVVRL